MGLDITVCRMVPTESERYFGESEEYKLFNTIKLKAPESIKSLISERDSTYYDWKKLGYKPSSLYEIKVSYGYGYDGTLMECIHAHWYKHFTCYNRRKYKKHKFLIDLNTMPTYHKMQKVFYYKEIGYQRKGANNAFYEDHHCKYDILIFTKAELKRYRDLYFDEAFDENIISKFIEGKDIVWFNW